MIREERNYFSLQLQVPDHHLGRSRQRDLKQLSHQPTCYNLTLPRRRRQGEGPTYISVGLLTLVNIIKKTQGQRDGSLIKITCYSFKGLEFSFYHPYGGSKISIPSFRESNTFCVCMCVFVCLLKLPGMHLMQIYTYRQHTHIHKIKINIKNKENPQRCADRSTSPRWSHIHTPLQVIMGCVKSQ